MNRTKGVAVAVASIKTEAAAIAMVARGMVAVVIKAAETAVAIAVEHLSRGRDRRLHSTPLHFFAIRKLLANLEKQ